MPAPEKRGEERLLHAAPINVNTPPGWELESDAGRIFRQNPLKAPYAEGGCNGFLA